MRLMESNSSLYPKLLSREGTMTSQHDCNALWTDRIPASPERHLVYTLTHSVVEVEVTPVHVFPDVSELETRRSSAVSQEHMEAHSQFHSLSPDDLRLRYEASPPSCISQSHYLEPSVPFPTISSSHLSPILEAPLEAFVAPREGSSQFGSPDIFAYTGRTQSYALPSVWRTQRMS